MSEIEKLKQDLLVLSDKLKQANNTINEFEKLSNYVAKIEKHKEIKTTPEKALVLLMEAYSV